jgi:hypothetical protein
MRRSGNNVTKHRFLVQSGTYLSYSFTRPTAVGPVKEWDKPQRGRECRSVTQGRRTVFSAVMQWNRINDGR